MCRAENNLQADNYWGGEGLGMVGGGGALRPPNLDPTEHSIIN